MCRKWNVDIQQIHIDRSGADVTCVTEGLNVLHAALLDHK